MNKKTKQGMAIILGIAILLAAYFTITTSMAATEGSYAVLTLHYVDGTSTTLTAGLTKGSMSIVDPASGKDVLSLDVALHVVAVFDGAVNSYTITSNAQWVLESSTGTVLQNLGSQVPISYTGGILHTGDDITVYTTILTMSSAQTQYSGWVDNTQYRFKMLSVGDLSMTLNFGDPVAPTPITKTMAVSQVSWLFRYHYPYAFTSLSASWTGTANLSPYV